MKILNLYAGIGGNRKLWGNEHDITAVEINEEIAEIYKHFFPNDKVIVADAHDYLLHNFEEYDFIWSSPPCPSHSKFRYMTTKMKNEKFKRDIIYPDMSLYQEIILLKHYYKKDWVVENVEPYYEPLIPAYRIGRHLIWSNVFINDKTYSVTKGRDFIKWVKNKDMEDIHGFDLSQFNIKSRKNIILRNCVHPEIGKYILECVIDKNRNLFTN